MKAWVLKKNSGSTCSSTYRSYNGFSWIMCRLSPDGGQWWQFYLFTATVKWKPCFITHHQIFHIESIVVSFIEHCFRERFPNMIISRLQRLYDSPVWIDDNADHDTIFDRLHISLPNILDWSVEFHTCSMIQVDTCAHFLDCRIVFCWTISCFAKIFTPLQLCAKIWYQFSRSNVKMLLEFMLYMYNRFTCLEVAFDDKCVPLLQPVWHGYWHILRTKLTVSTIQYGALWPLYLLVEHFYKFLESWKLFYCPFTNLKSKKPGKACFPTNTRKINISLETMGF